MVRAEGADFAAIARENSDGPSAARGGDLGSFGRGVMHPMFERTVFELPVDALSDVIETPFGFHIIQRYR
jgi:parvulin-like peptidyl-prolyl isomerase